MKIMDLKERRATIVAELRSIADKPEKDGDLSETQEKRFGELKGELANLEKRLERQTFVDEADRRATGHMIESRGDDRLEDELRSFSILRAIAGQCGMDVDDGRERELSRELAKRSGRAPKGIFVPMEVFHKPLEKRVLTSTSPAGGPGSNIIATDHRGQDFIDRLRAALVINQLGARVLNGLSGNVDIPKLKASASSGWIAENQALTLSDHQFDKVSLTPKHAGAITELSRNMLQQSSPDIEDLVRGDFAAILAEAVDSVAIDGGGTNEPTGILQTAGIGSVAMGTNGGALTLDATADLIGAVTQANAGTARRSFLGSEKVRTATMKLKDADGRPFGLETVFHGEARSFSTLVPDDGAKGTGTGLSTLIYGDWSDLIIGYWSQFDLLVNPYESTAFKKGNVQIRAMLTTDIVVRHAASFAAITDIDTAA